jgi:hypothetical protein
LQAHGLVIVRDAFEPARIDDLLANVALYGSSVESVLRSGGIPQLDPFHVFLPRALAGNLTALDPVTAKDRVDDFARTTLCAALMTDFIHSILIDVLGPRSGWALARTRIVIPRLEGQNGQLALHMEKTAVKFPGLHVIWTPLTPPSLITNLETPGIQFYVGRLDFFERAPSHEVSDYIASLAPGAGEDRWYSDDHGFLYRPRLKAGDVAIFSGSVPHASFMPNQAQTRRVGCDIRVFPWTEDNHLPVEAIQLGQRPGPLIPPRAEHASALSNRIFN